MNHAGRGGEYRWLTMCFTAGVVAKMSQDLPAPPPPLLTPSATRSSPAFALPVSSQRPFAGTECQFAGFLRLMAAQAAEELSPTPAPRRYSCREVRRVRRITWGHACASHHVCVLETRFPWPNSEILITTHCLSARYGRKCDYLTHLKLQIIMISSQLLMCILCKYVIILNGKPIWVLNKVYSQKLRERNSLPKGF